MPTFHKNFPWGKGMWIWNLPKCEGGDIAKIIEKCKKYNISYVIVKSYDGENAFPNNARPQLTKEISAQFHASGISIYSWSYNYGYNPDREAALALWSLEQLGVDGHIFDAETEWEKLPNPGATANQMLQKVREKQPNAFLAHAPYPYIDYHTRFAYVEFGKYCDAVMPQVYWGTIGISVEKMVADMFAQWSKWEKTWRDNGHADSVKPIVPLGQTYDNPAQNFVMTPAQLTDFISRLAAYGSINFWDWEHTLRADLWTAIGTAQVKRKEEIPGAVPVSQNPTPPVNSAPAPVVPSQPETAAPQQPAPTTTVSVEVPTNPSSSTPTQTTTPSVPEASTPAQPASPTTTTTIPVPVKDSGATTVTVTKDEDHPDGVKVDIRTHKAHIDYLIGLIMAIINFFKGANKK